MSIDHWMLFSTFAEQRHFEYPVKGTYTGVVINANMAAHAPAGLAAFLLTKTSGLPYLIDPLTHAFQHDPEVLLTPDGEPKSSIRGLADAYGEPVGKLVGRRPVLPGHFKDDEVLRGFTERCLRFQMEHLVGFMKASDAAKYLDASECQAPPYAVIAPYFFLSETTVDDWLPVCTRALSSAAAVLSSRGGAVPKLFASVVVSQGVLVDAALRDRICKEMLGQPADGFLLWADNLDEQTASKAELQGLVALARGLRKNNTREVINLHGGYFSILAAGTLGARALSGVTHAPEFGEFRAVVPVGGGIPISRYYIPNLHARVRFRDAVRFFNAKKWLEDAKTFHAEICACDSCVEVIAGDVDRFTLFGESTVKSVRRKQGIVRLDYPTTEAKLRCLTHYLQRKRLEYQMADTMSGQQLLDNLETGFNTYQEVAGLEAVSHLRRWAQVLKPPGSAS